MSVDRAALGSIRRALEHSYGLALEGLTEDQISVATASAIGEDGALEADDPRLLPLVVDRLPIDESWLFRDDALWTWLKDELGPALLERSALRGRAVRALSLGCSSGQEAFSLAILFQGLLAAAGIPESSAPAYVEISGLDASPARIAQARDGLVNDWSMQRCRADWLRGRIVPAGGGDGRMRVAPPIKAMCRFEVGNVLDVTARGNDALAGYDLVLCRHVLIYFRADRAARVVADLGEALDRQAVLVVSAAEAHLLAAAPFLEPVGHLGAARAGPPAVAERTRPAETPRPPESPARSRSRRVAPPPPGRVAAAGPAPGERRAAEEHLRRALEHAGAGRGADALQEARAAFFLEPRHLFSRLLLGRELLSLDRERGREVLRDLLHHASLLPPEADVPFAPGLSVAQLARAARLLLDPSEGA
jgi:chemotaxis protein methyltransferase CheR